MSGPLSPLIFPPFLEELDLNRWLLKPTYEHSQQASSPAVSRVFIDVEQWLVRDEDNYLEPPDPPEPAQEWIPRVEGCHCLSHIDTISASPSEHWLAVNPHSTSMEAARRIPDPSPETWLLHASDGPCQEPQSMELDEPSGVQGLNNTNSDSLQQASDSGNGNKSPCKRQRQEEHSGTSNEFTFDMKRTKEEQGSVEGDVCEENL